MAIDRPTGAADSGQTDIAFSEKLRNTIQRTFDDGCKVVKLDSCALLVYSKLVNARRRFHKQLARRKRPLYAKTYKTHVNTIPKIVAAVTGRNWSRATRFGCCFDLRQKGGRRDQNKLFL